MVNLLTNMIVLIVRGVITLVETIKIVIRKIKEQKLMELKLKKGALDFSDI